MIRVGILGDIGSGKTFVANSFGYPVFNADKEVIKIYKNYGCFLKLKKNFPKYITKFPVKKYDIVKLINSNIKNIKKIGKIVHPYVSNNLKKFLIKYKQDIVVLDIPLLLENKIKINNLYFVFVNSKKKEINKRLKKRPNFNKKLYKLIKKNQLPLSIKKKKSKFILNNDFRKITIMKNIKKIKKELKNL